MHTTFWCSLDDAGESFLCRDHGREMCGSVGHGSLELLLPLRRLLRQRPPPALDQRRGQRRAQDQHGRQADERRHLVVRDADQGRGTPGGTYLSMEMRGIHGGVVHAGDGHTHQDRRTPLSHRRDRPPIVRRVVSELEREPQRSQRDRNGDGDRRTDPPRIVVNESWQPHRRHAGVVHPDDPATKRNAREGQPPAAQRGTARDGERERRCNARHGDRRTDPKGIIGHWDWKPQRQHANEMHAPDADAHRQCARCEPYRAASTGRGRNAGCECERRIAGERGDDNRRGDERAVVRGVQDRCHCSRHSRSPAQNASLRRLTVARRGHVAARL